MEIHAHSHTARKKWTHYLWEFLMLFLAVFCGFLAENVREHLVEKYRENKYIATLAKELKYDCEQYDTVMANMHYISPVLDSLYYNAKNASEFNYRLLAKWNTPVNEVQI